MGTGAAPRSDLVMYGGDTWEWSYSGGLAGGDLQSAGVDLVLEIRRHAGSSALLAIIRVGSGITIVDGASASLKVESTVTMTITIGLVHCQLKGLITTESPEFVQTLQEVVIDVREWAPS